MEDKEKEKKKKEAKNEATTKKEKTVKKTEKKEPEKKESKKKETAKKRKLNLKLIIPFVLSIILTLVFIYNLNKLKILTSIYMILVIFVLILINGIIFILLAKKKKVPYIIGIVIAVVLLLIELAGTYYIVKTNDFLDKSFKESEYTTYTTTYYIVALSKNNYKDIDDIKNSNVGYYSIMPNQKTVLNKFNKLVKTNTSSFEDLNDMFNNLNSENINAMLIEKNIFDFVFENSKTYNRDNYNIVKEFKITYKEKNKKKKSSNNDSINIYVGGKDFTDTNRDFNMIITINKSTNKILLTSTPRDFYVYSPRLGMKELLGYTGVYGINGSIEAMETLYDIDIDYYLDVNTSSLVGLVDTIGGVTFCNSDKAFTTTHAMIQGSYDDRRGKKLYVEEGCREYNGIQILTIARERLHVYGGDYKRQQNCQQILVNIAKKMMSKDAILNYANVLDAVSNLYETNIPRDIITNLANLTISGANWEFEQQTVNGTGSKALVHVNTVSDYVTIPNEDTVADAKAKIDNVMKGK